MSTLDRHTEEFDVKEDAVYREMQQFREIDEDWFARLKAKVNEPLEQLTEKFGDSAAADEVPTSTVAELAERLVLRLGRGALVQSVPLVGAAIGGGMDEIFMKHVCKTAQHCYRERWLLRRYADSDNNRQLY